MLSSLDEEPGGEVALGFSASGEPEYVTTQPPLIEIPAPLLVADIWMPSSPSSTGDLDAQPMIQSQGPRSPTVAGVPGGRHSSGPQGFGASSPGGGSPGGGKSGPRNPSSPTASGPTAPPSDPTPRENGPLVAGPAATPPSTSNPGPQTASIPDAPANPPATANPGPSAPPPVTSNPGPQTASVPDAPANPPANSQPGPVDLPDALTGPVVGLNNNPQDDWLSPGHSPGIRYEDTFELNGRTLLFEILGPSAEDPIQYDQLIVEGIVNLNYGNIVFAFINGYPDAASTDWFDLIIADIINLEDAVAFYYGFFDESFPEHAPYDLAEYSPWTDGKGDIFGDLDKGESVDRVKDGLLAIRYDSRADDGQTTIANLVADSGDNGEGTFNPVDIGAEIPAPAPLLLLATGLLLAGSVRRRA